MFLFAEYWRGRITLRSMRRFNDLEEALDHGRKILKADHLPPALKVLQLRLWEVETASEPGSIDDFQRLLLE